MARTAVRAAVIAGAILTGSSALTASGGPPALELYLSPNRTFALYKPAGWEVSTVEHPNGRTVMVVAPHGHAFAQVTSLKTEDRGSNSVQLAANTLGNVRAQIPALHVAWVRSTPDRRRTAVEVEYEKPDKTLVRGRQYFIVSYPEARVFGYETVAAEFGRMQPALLSILANFTALDPAQWKDPGGGGRVGAPLEVALAPRALPDRSASLMLPRDWQLVGAKGAVLAKSPSAAADRLLPLAAARGVAVLTNLPFRRGRVFQALGSRPVPEWAAELGIGSWAQFALKYVISHPAVTCAIPGTARLVYLVDNLGAARGPLPDEATRRRMAALIDAA